MARRTPRNQNEVSFSVTLDERETIRKIVDRAVKLAKEDGFRLDSLELNMDITACHANGNPLRLDELLAADDFNFAHDVFGIHRHINRDTAQLENFFSPRFSAPRRRRAA